MTAHIIDKHGKIIYTAPKIGYTYFSEGLCRVIIDNHAGGYKSGYIDTTGKLVIPYQFDDADFFQGGVARVKKDDKWGLINSKGKLICPYYHSDMEEVPIIHDGIICKWEENSQDKNHAKLSYIDIDGNVLIDTSKYSYIDDFCNGHAYVKRNDRDCALINTKGEIVIPFGKYDFIGEVHCGVAEVQKYIDNKTCYGYVNTLGEEVVPIGKYDQFYWHDPELCVVCAIKGDVCGYIDKYTGQEIIPCVYKFNSRSTNAAISRGIYNDYNELSMFVIILKDHVQTTNNEKYVYNAKLHKVYNLKDVDNVAYHYSEGLCAVEKDSKIGFIDETAKLVIPFKFPVPENGIGSSLTTYREGVCAIGNMLVDKQGNIIKSFGEEFYRLHYIGDGTYSLDSRTGINVALVNLKGDMIFNGYRTKSRFPLNSEFPIAVIDKNISYNNTWRFINKDGKSAFPYKFREGYEFVNGYAVIYEAIIKNGHVTTSSSNDSKSGCYIATAVYGSYDCPEVWTLRRYRDNVLDNSWYGRLFIRAYYAISPRLVKWFGTAKWFRSLFYNPLNRWVNKLNEQGFKNTPYRDKY
ncbi:WG repeat-containing protein [bacterium]|nr:WG repeat-containing protein [bacterium]